MMDIKLVTHAKEYIDDMAKGIHPLTKEELPEGDSLNNVRISRCLFFVSEVLEEVIENGGVKKPKREKKQPFNIDAIDWSRYKYYKTPQNISDMAKQINALKPENMNNLKVTALTDWLVDIGMLEIITINGKNRKYPTQKGLAMGIIKEERMGIYGAYTVVMYDESAQHFVIDNLAAVIEGGFNNKSDRTPKEE